MIHLGSTQIQNSGSTSELFKKIRLASKRLLCSEAMLTQLEVVISKLCCACMTEGHYIEADILLDTFKGNYGIQLTLSHVMKEANLPLAEDFFDAYLIKHQEDRTYQVCAIKYLTAVNSILDQNIFELNILLHCFRNSFYIPFSIKFFIINSVSQQRNNSFQPFF